jgi:hypothetical protein
MKSIQSIFTAGLLLAAFTASAWSIVLPPTDDTSSTITFKGKPPVVSKTEITNAAGTSPILSVSKTHDAFIQFGVGAINSSGTVIPAASVTRATLTIFFPAVSKAGDLQLSVVTGTWSETFSGPPQPQPAFGAAFATIPADQVASKQFVLVPVTAQVQAWLSGTTPDFGFAITTGTDDIAKVTISSKEGPAIGYEATLEIETDSNVASSGNFIISSGDVGIGTSSPVATLDVAPPSGASVVGYHQDSNGSFQIDSAGVPGGRFNIQTNGQVNIGGPVNIQNSLEVGGTDVFDVDSVGNVGGRFAVKANGTVEIGANGIFDVDATNVSGGRFTILANGDVGIGDTSPGDALDVNGNVKLGSNEQFFAPGSPENLQLVRGNIVASGTTVTAVDGTGYTVARKSGAPAGDFVITFTTAFTAEPTATVTPVSGAGIGGLTAISVGITSNSQVEIQTFSGSTLTDEAFGFIVVGPR